MYSHCHLVVKPNLICANIWDNICGITHFQKLCTLGSRQHCVYPRECINETENTKIHIKVVDSFCFAFLSYWQTLSLLGFKQCTVHNSSLYVNAFWKACTQHLHLLGCGMILLHRLFSCGFSLDAQTWNLALLFKVNKLSNAVRILNFAINKHIKKTMQTLQKSSQNIVL